jgi:hypothetical protein
VQPGKTHCFEDQYICSGGQLYELMAGHDCFAAHIPLFQEDPHWRDLLFFHEYFHGDSGAGLGASHQTGWTGLVANLLQTPALPFRH